MSIEAKVCVTLERAADGKLFLHTFIDGVMPELSGDVTREGPTTVSEAAARSLLLELADMAIAFNPEG